MQLTFGTGGAQQVPVFGCDCLICQRSGASRHFGGERAAPCLTIRGNDLIGCGIAGFGAAIFGGANSTFLLTHYHMDHVQGLFPLRWGCGNSIPVYGPPDEQGCDDLFKHPGILAFQPPLTPFATVELGGMRITRCRCNTPN